MKVDTVPLLEIFNSLRQKYSFPLGIEEYLVMIECLQGGVGIETQKTLEQLCCTLWAKSPDDIRVIKKLFVQMWEKVEDYVPIEPEEISSIIRSEDPQNPLDHNPITKIPDQSLSTESDLSTPELKEDPLPPTEDPHGRLEMGEPIEVAKAMRNRYQDTLISQRRYSFFDDYFPVTQRQMKQIWRYLRRPVREGVPTEFDVEATVNKMGSKGLFCEPVLIPRRINRTDLVLMIDQDGSMVPFHALSRQLVETAERGGRLRKTRVFYFHDYVDEYLYRHPALFDAQSLNEMLAEVGERAVVLIISDGGAARGNFDSERVTLTYNWLKQLQQSVRYVAWLNPMPSDSWLHTTAAEIAGMLPMFEISREGMNAAISVLQGRYIPWERRYQWLR